ncbi:MarR family winged helix-turn-helix transcriptional regulator [Stackebrandtia endophytica]|nr:MarR family winged helix-turn-helix transcriptional regulator [Stackebrandtia endophytica]
MTSHPGRELFDFVRHWSRRWTGVGITVDRDRGRDVSVTEAALAHGAGGATVNQIAAELGIDQSGASRMVTQAIERGYLTKTTGGDARRRLVHVTEAGEALVAASHAWQDRIFADLTNDWTPTEVEQFSHLMKRLTAAHRDR